MTKIAKVAKVFVEFLSKYKLKELSFEKNHDTFSFIFKHCEKREGEEVKLTSAKGREKCTDLTRCCHLKSKEKFSVLL